MTTQKSRTFRGVKESFRGFAGHCEAHRCRSNPALAPLSLPVPTLSGRSNLGGGAIRIATQPAGARNDRLRKCGKMKMVGPNSNVKGVFQGSSRGFTMIEVLIAIAILGISSIGFLGALATTSLSVGRADERTVAESLARKQMEYVKNQVYQAAPTNGIATYQKISGIPGNYTIWSVNRAGTVVPDIVGIPWDSENSKPLNQTAKDIGLQKISLVIMHEGEVIFSFVNKNPVWAYNATITLEGYKVER